MVGRICAGSHAVCGYVCVDWFSLRFSFFCVLFCCCLTANKDVQKNFKNTLIKSLRTKKSDIRLYKKRKKTFLMSIARDVFQPRTVMFHYMKVMFLVFVLLCIFVPLVFSPSVFCTYCLWTVSLNKIEFFYIYVFTFCHFYPMGRHCAGICRRSSRTDSGNCFAAVRAAPSAESRRTTSFPCTCVLTPASRVT